MSSIRILILDDESEIRTEIREFLHFNGFIVYEAATPDEAFRIFDNESIDIVILDIRLPQMSGLQVLKEIRKLNPDLEVIMISGHGDMDSVIEALRYGASDFLKKPFHLKEVLSSIEKSAKFVRNKRMITVSDHHEMSSNPDLWKRIGSPFIFGSAAMEHLYDQMVRVSQADTTTVLISGESGTGKELVARGIHFMSRRKDQAYHSVNCSSIPDELFESEFFGYIKGAFTGANLDKPGWFEAANKGTLFLDEIGDLKLSLQAKLLRVIEDQQICRLGSTKQIKVNVRLITATNHNLEKMVESERFRQDLFHRLNIFTIHIPPLRERKEDIPMLLNYFVKYYSGKLGRNITTISKGLMEALNEYDFPGNIRELKHMTERAVILCDDEELSFDHFDHLSVKLRQTRPRPEMFIHNLSLDYVEREYIEKALREVMFNKSQAARLLNLSRQALDRKMAKYGISLTKEF
jgi:DNA-binding NtrC family response regulator